MSFIALALEHFTDVVKQSDRFTSRRTGKSMKETIDTIGTTFYKPQSPTGSRYINEGNYLTQTKILSCAGCFVSCSWGKYGKA